MCFIYHYFICCFSWNEWLALLKLQAWSNQMVLICSGLWHWLSSIFNFYFQKWNVIQKLDLQVDDCCILKHFIGLCLWFLEYFDSVVFSLFSWKQVWWTVFVWHRRIENKKKNERNYRIIISSDNKILKNVLNLLFVSWFEMCSTHTKIYSDSIECVNGFVRFEGKQNIKFKINKFSHIVVMHSQKLIIIFTMW